jgi:uncharacterized protein YqeY
MGIEPTMARSGSGNPTARGGSGNLRDRLRGALPGAMKARDSTAVAALRSALAAIDNAEAVGAAQAPPPDAGRADLVGTVAGLGAAEVEWRTLSEAQVEKIVRAEVADRRTAAQVYEQAGQPGRAERLRAEADVLGSHLGWAESAAGEAGQPADSEKLGQPADSEKLRPAEPPPDRGEGMQTEPPASPALRRITVLVRLAAEGFQDAFGARPDWVEVPGSDLGTLQEEVGAAWAERVSGSMGLRAGAGYAAGGPAGTVTLAPAAHGGVLGLLGLAALPPDVLVEETPDGPRYLVPEDWFVAVPAGDPGR